jgi:hypothetical protein
VNLIVVSNVNRLSSSAQQKRWSGVMDLRDNQLIKDASISILIKTPVYGTYR